MIKLRMTIRPTGTIIEETSNLSNYSTTHKKLKLTKKQIENFISFSNNSPPSSISSNHQVV